MDPPLQKLYANICNHAPFCENGIRANQFSKASVIQRFKVSAYVPEKLQANSMSFVNQM